MLNLTSRSTILQKCISSGKSPVVSAARERAIHSKLSRGYDVVKSTHRCRRLSAHALGDEDYLGRFIAALNINGDQPGETYEHIRHDLIAYFQRRQCVNSEDLADEVIDRTAQRYTEARNLSQFIRGIARRVASEHFRRPKSISIAEVSEAHLKTEPEDCPTTTESERLNTLDALLRTLPDQDRQMVLRYYSFEGAAKIKNRRRLAAELNTSVEALTVRVLRIRRTLRERWDLAV